MNDATTHDQRRAIEDLVRAQHAVEGALEAHRGDIRVSAAPGRWSPSEHALHVILTLETVAARFAERAARPVEPLPEWSLRQAAARRLVLATHRIPSGVSAPAELEPKVLLGADELRSQLRRAREGFLPLLHLADRSRRECWLPHFALGPMSFLEWTRFLRVHALHHARIIRHGGRAERA